MDESFKGRKTTCRLCAHKFTVTKKSRSSWLTVGKMRCPKCHVTYCNLPDSEKILMDWQDLYFENKRSEVYLSKMYQCLVSYANSLLLKKYYNQVPTQEVRDEHSHNAATFLLENYLFRENFRINASFAGFLLKKIQFSIYGPQNKPSGDLSMDYKYAQSDEDEVSGLVNKTEMEVALLETTNLERLEEETNAEKTLDYLINGISLPKTYCKDSKENLLRLLGVLVFFREGEVKSDKIFQVYNREGREMFQKTMSFMHQELKELVND